MTTPFPSCVLPEMPTWATMIEYSPITTLWAIWTRLSIFTPRWIQVLPRVPRSMVVFAPISTSSSIWTIADLGDLRYFPAGIGEPEPVTADDDAGMQDDPPADQAAAVEGDAGIEDGRLADDGIPADEDPRVENRPASRSAPRG